MSPGAARRSAALVALLVVFLWATSWVLVKFGLEAIPPLTFAGLRYGVASLVLLAVAYQTDAAGLRSAGRSGLGQLAALGILLYAVTQGAIFVALDSLPAVTVNLLWSFSAIVVAGMAAWWLAERPTKGQWIGVLAATGGALLYFLPAEIAVGDRLGFAAAVVGVIANGGAVILGRRVNRSERWSPLVVTAVSMAVGAALLLALGFASEDAPKLDGRGWAIIGWLALVNTALAFTLWNRTLRVLTAVESSVINGTMLIWIPLLAVLFLGETLTSREIVGLVLVGLGTLLVQLRSAIGTARDLPR